MTAELPAVDDLLERARAAYLATAAPTPPGLVETAMRTVTAELRPGRRIALPATSGRGFVLDVAVANALRLALDDDPAVMVRRCRVEAGRGAIRVRLSVAVSYEHWDRHRDDVVRNRIVAVARSLFGLPIDGVDIDIVDVITEGDDV